MLKAETFVEENGLLNQEPSERALTKIDRLDENSNLLFKKKKKTFKQTETKKHKQMRYTQGFCQPSNNLEHALYIQNI